MKVDRSKKGPRQSEIIAGERRGRALQSEIGERAGSHASACVDDPGIWAHISASTAMGRRA